MAKSILLSTVICTLIVLHLTTITKAQWKQCFDDSCPIKNIKFTEKSRSYEFEAEFEKTTSLWTPNVDKTGFELKAPPSDGPGQTIEIECDNSNVLFTCNARVTQIYKDASNQTITDYNIYPEINGTAIYINDKLYCSWAITMNDYTFPYELIDPPQYYISNRGYQIYYNLTQSVPVAAANYSQLPASVEPFVNGYQYKAVGSEKYLLITRVTSEKTDFLLKNNGEAEDKKLVEVNLKSDINSINIQCDFTIGTYYVFGFTNDYDMKSQRDILDVGKINGDKCLWSLDDSLEVHSLTVKPKKTTYELQIIENKRFVHYDEKDFRIPASSASSSNNMTIAKSLLIVMLFSVFFI